MKRSLQMKATHNGLTRCLIVLLALSAALIGGSAYAQTPLSWTTPLRYDNGEQPSVALLRSGLVVEFHKSATTSSLYYHIGRVALFNKVINWGDSQPLGYSGSSPDVAVTKEGYVLLVYTKFAHEGYGSEVQMRYWVGEINPEGGIDQTITWRIRDAFFDTGLYASLAFNSDAVLAEVHEGFHT